MMDRANYFHATTGPANSPRELIVGTWQFYAVVLFLNSYNDHKLTDSDRAKHNDYLNAFKNAFDEYF